MKLKNILSTSITILALLIFRSVSFAQDKKETEPAKGTLSEEIEVVRPYKPVLANASKIRRNPDLNDTPPFKPMLTYSILDKKLELNTDIRQLQYQQLPAEKPELLQNNYAKLGLGNFKTGLGEIYINTGRDEALQVGFFARHLSQAGEINKQQFSNQEFALFGKSIGAKSTLSGKVNYTRLGTYFYGSDPLALVNTDPEKQKLQVFNLQGELAKRFSNNPNEWDYALRADAAIFSNQLKGRGNSIIISGFGIKSWKEFSYGLNTSMDFTNVKDQAYTFGNHLLKINPFAQYQGAGFIFKLGLNIVQEMGAVNKLNPLPAVSVEATIVPESATFFAGLSGDVKKTSLNELSFENPYLGENIAITNMVEKSNIYAGIKGNLGSGFGFKAMAYFKRVEQLPLFINDPANLSHFQVIYDSGTSKITGLEAEFDIKASDIFQLGAKLQTINYKLSTEAKAWFKPSFRLETQAEAKVNQKLNLRAAFVFNGETYAKIDALQPEDQAVRIKNFMDLSAGANYQINKKLGVYIQANNVLGTVYQQYLYYPKLGFNLFGGINYSF